MVAERSKKSSVWRKTLNIEGECGVMEEGEL